jgi:hypothetical protein
VGACAGTLISHLSLSKREQHDVERTVEQECSRTRPSDFKAFAGLSIPLDTPVGAQARMCHPDELGEPMRLDPDAPRAELRAISGDLAAVRRRAEVVRVTLGLTEEFAAAEAAASAGRIHEAMASLVFSWHVLLEEIEGDCARLAAALQADAAKVE